MHPRHSNQLIQNSKKFPEQNSPSKYHPRIVPDVVSVSKPVRRRIKPRKDVKLSTLLHNHHCENQKAIIGISSWVYPNQIGQRSNQNQLRILNYYNHYLSSPAHAPAVVRHPISNWQPNSSEIEWLWQTQQDVHLSLVVIYLPHHGHLIKKARGLLGQIHYLKIMQSSDSVCVWP